MPLACIGLKFGGPTRGAAASTGGLPVQRMESCEPTPGPTTGTMDAATCRGAGPYLTYALSLRSARACSELGGSGLFADQQRKAP